MMQPTTGTFATKVEMAIVGIQVVTRGTPPCSLQHSPRAGAKTRSVLVHPNMVNASTRQNNSHKLTGAGFYHSTLYALLLLLYMRLRMSISLYLPCIVSLSVKNGSEGLSHIAALFQLLTDNNTHSHLLLDICTIMCMQARFSTPSSPS